MKFGNVYRFFSNDFLIRRKSMFCQIGIHYNGECGLVTAFT